MAKLYSYLIFNGTCQQAFDFYKSVFNTEYSDFSTFGDMPQDDTTDSLSESDSQRVMHVCLPINKDYKLMGSDSNSKSGDVIMGSNISVSIDADSREEATTLFEGLSKNGNILMPQTDTFWGAYFGMFTDKFGVNWMINYDEVK